MRILKQKTPSTYPGYPHLQAVSTMDGWMDYNVCMCVCQISQIFTVKAFCPSTIDCIRAFFHSLADLPIVRPELC